jgi:DNA-binding NarL/FixJ family response regulator
MRSRETRPIWPADVDGLARPRLPAVMALEPAHLRDALSDGLSEQQKRVLLLLSEGYANKTIAWVLGIEEVTAKAHVCSILRKFQLTNRTQAALLGLRLRLLSDDCAIEPRSAATRSQAEARPV